MSTTTVPTPVVPVALPETRARSRRTGAFLRATAVVQGVALAVLTGRDGAPGWQAARVIAVALAVAVVLAGLRSRERGRRGLVASAFGLVGLVGGSAIGVMHTVNGVVDVPAVAGLVLLATGLVLLGAGVGLLVRILPGWWRLLAIPAALVVVQFVVFPLVVAVYATNVPPTTLGSETPADWGLAYEDVEFAAGDEVVLSGWYIPGRERAAVIVLHGSGSTRSNVLRHAAVLAGHGYGVLLFDARGHGLSAGDAMDLGWYGDDDIGAALEYLTSRPDVDADRIAAVGTSMGGEQAIGALAAEERLRAVVAEGATGRVGADHEWMREGPTAPVAAGVDWVTDTAADLLSGAGRPIGLRDAMAAGAPRPVLLIAAGTVPREIDAARHIAGGSPETAEVWVVPDAGHTDGLAVDPEEWERRVIGFLDDAVG
jgi:dienelactone hydrolase